MGTVLLVFVNTDRTVPIVFSVGVTGFEFYGLLW